VLLGSVAEKVIRHADRPVLVLPAPEKTGPKPGGRRTPSARSGKRFPSPPGPDRARRRTARVESAATGRGSDAWRARLAAKNRPGDGPPWDPHAHPGRAGPAGRRGSGQARGKGKGPRG
jgi:hypothetical protein